ncbi:hypothetical protein BMJ21_21035 [Sinorhizobium medicae]|nr:hypothetical protein BMJ21_21035 [Sinorhizobium medicae]
MRQRYLWTSAVRVRFTRRAVSLVAPRDIFGRAPCALASRVEPLAWLRHVLTELPQRADFADITDLLSFNFPKTTTAG